MLAAPVLLSHGISVRIVSLSLPPSIVLTRPLLLCLEEGEQLLLDVADELLVALLHGLAAGRGDRGHDVTEHLRARHLPPVPLRYRIVLHHPPLKLWAGTPRE